MRILIVSLLFAFLPVSSQAQERRPMTTDDGLNMVRVGDALMSPDGRWVLFSRSELDWEENERKTTWWKVPSDAGEEPYRFIGEEGGSSFAFSPDGRWLSFRREVDDKNQLFLMRTDGGEALQLSDHETSVGSYALVSRPAHGRSAPRLGGLRGQPAGRRAGWPRHRAPGRRRRRASGRRGARTRDP